MTHFQIDSLIMTEVQHQHRFGILQFCRDFLQVVVTQILTAGRELQNVLENPSALLDFILYG